MSKDEKLRAHIEELLSNGGAMVHKDGTSTVVMIVGGGKLQGIDVIPEASPEVLGEVVLRALEE